MRIATYNVEWFASLFDQHNNLINDETWSGRWDVTKSQQIKALGQVFRAVNADAFMIIEAPNTGSTQSTIKALENFARRARLRQKRAITGFTNDTQQEIALLFDPNKLSVEHDPKGRKAPEGGGRVAPRFDTSFKIDLNVDNQPEEIIFSKPPLELLLMPNDGPDFRLIGVHAKSKAPHGARDEAEARRISISNRRKQLAQCIWLRQRVDDHIAAKDKTIVLGDFNDGPGLDEYEKLFGHSGVEIVMGTTKPYEQQLYDPHASNALRPGLVARQTTARFYNHRKDTFLNALLDYVMVSADVKKDHNPKWKIWHPFDDPQCYKNRTLCQALLRASDHFPVSIDLDF